MLALSIFRTTKGPKDQINPAITTIGIAIFEDEEDRGKLQFLTHITPVVKPKPKDNIELLMKKAHAFENEFLEKYSDIEIDRVFIEEPLLRSNNVNTVATLLRFNGMICRSVYEVLNGNCSKFISIKIRFFNKFVRFVFDYIK